VADLPAHILRAVERLELFYQNKHFCFCRPENLGNIIGRGLRQSEIVLKDLAEKYGWIWPPEKLVPGKRSLTIILARRRIHGERPVFDPDTDCLECVRGWVKVLSSGQKLLFRPSCEHGSPRTPLRGSAQSSAPTSRTPLRRVEVTPSFEVFEREELEEEKTKTTTACDSAPAAHAREAAGPSSSFLDSSTPEIAAELLELAEQVAGRGINAELRNALVVYPADAVKLALETTRARARTCSVRNPWGYALGIMGKQKGRSEPKRADPPALVPNEESQRKLKAIREASDRKAAEARLREDLQARFRDQPQNRRRTAAGRQDDGSTGPPAENAADGNSGDCEGMPDPARPPPIGPVGTRSEHFY